jgi:hypothetical protein
MQMTVPKGIYFSSHTLLKLKKQRICLFFIVLVDGFFNGKHQKAINPAKSLKYLAISLNTPYLQDISIKDG